MPKVLLSIPLLVIVAAIAGCSRREAPPPAADTAEPTVITNRIDIPEAVRRNLGIEFGRVERRPVLATRRLPGTFAQQPGAEAVYRAPLSGRLRVLVAANATVSEGDLLAEIESPDLAPYRMAIAEAEQQSILADARVRLAEAEVAEAEAQQATLRAARDGALAESESLSRRQAEAAALENHWAGRVRDLEKIAAGGGGAATELAEARARVLEARLSVAEAEADAAALKSRIAESEASVAAGITTLARVIAARGGAEQEARAASLAIDRHVSALAGVSGLSVAQLREIREGVAQWQNLDRLEIRARSAGTVTWSAFGSDWADAGSELVHVRDLTRLWLVARVPSSLASQISPGMNANVLVEGREQTPGTLAFPGTGTPDPLSILIAAVPGTLPAGVRPGSGGVIEVVLSADTAPLLAVPRGAVVREGNTHVLFRRDPANPDKVIRLEAEILGDDGAWIAVGQGVMPGDEVVVAGAYELMLASSGTAQAGGHFHADGTFHAGPDH